MSVSGNFNENVADPAGRDERKLFWAVPTFASKRICVSKRVFLRFRGNLQAAEVLVEAVIRPC